MIPFSPEVKSRGGKEVEPNLPREEEITEVNQEKDTTLEADRKISGLEIEEITIIRMKEEKKKDLEDSKATEEIEKEVKAKA